MWWIFPWPKQCYTTGMGPTNYSLYLTHSSEDENWQMVCLDAGSTVIPPGSPYPPHPADHPAQFLNVAVGRRINDFQLVYIPSGRGQLEMSGKVLDIEAGSLFLLFPNVWHAYHPDPDTGWTEYWVGCTGPQMEALLATGVIGPEKPLFHPGRQSSLLVRFQSVFELLQKQEPLYQFQVCSEILWILAETLKLERMSVQQTRAQEIVEHAKAFIAANLRTTINLDQLGEELHLSLPQLNEIFKAYTGMTPYSYCIHVRINRAKEILSSGELSIKEIAWQLGFEDAHYFSRLFKKKTGYSPTDWAGQGPPEELQPSISRRPQASQEESFREH